MPRAIALASGPGVYITVHRAEEFGMWSSGFHYCINIHKGRPIIKKVVSVRTYGSEDGAVKAGQRLLTDLTTMLE